MSHRPQRGTPSLTSTDVLERVWKDFRAGQHVTCPRDGEPLALSIDASSTTYRFVCTQCGHASPVFEATADGVRVCDFSGDLFDPETMTDE